MPNFTPKSNIDDTAHQVEAIGTWDHGVEGIDTVNVEDGSHKIVSIQDFVNCAAKAIENASKVIGGGINTLKEKERNCSDLLHDRRMREDYQQHTEEIVAGEKMAVKPIIHEHSFDAPC